jgi:hypothetical protein
LALLTAYREYDRENEQKVCSDDSFFLVLSMGTCLLVVSGLLLQFGMAIHITGKNGMRAALVRGELQHYPLHVTYSMSIGKRLRCSDAILLGNCSLAGNHLDTMLFLIL